jgi:hypothetical protein
MSTGGQSKAPRKRAVEQRERESGSPGSTQRPKQPRRDEDASAQSSSRPGDPGAVTGRYHAPLASRPSPGESLMAPSEVLESDWEPEPEPAFYTQPAFAQETNEQRDPTPEDQYRASLEALPALSPATPPTDDDDYVHSILTTNFGARLPSTTRTTFENMAYSCQNINENFELGDWYQPLFIESKDLQLFLDHLKTGCYEAVVLLDRIIYRYDGELWFSNPSDPVNGIGGIEH